MTRSVTPEEYSLFWKFLFWMWAIAESQGNPQIVYSILQANLDKLDDGFVSTLQVWTTETLSKVEPIQAKAIFSCFVNFGSFILQFPLGNKAINIEISIAAYNNALKLFTYQDFPQDWAMTQTNLASAYGQRIWGDRAENLEKAIKCSQKVLQVYTRTAFPQNWAKNQANLASAYSICSRGDKAENLEKAIEYYQQALQVFKREAFSSEWAQIQNDLGLVYTNRIRGVKAENLERAIEFSQNALQVYTRETFSYEWAKTQNNLAMAYCQRIQGEKAENLERAIESYQQALRVYTRETFPSEWARIQNNLAETYRILIQRDKAENLERAIQFCQKALQVRTREAFPRDYISTQFNLGLIYRDAQHWQDVYSTLSDSIDTVESLREEILSGDESKQKLAEEWNKCYTVIVEACLRLNKPAEGLEYVERSKNRNLVEQILLRDSHTIFRPDIAERLAQLRDEIASAQYKIQQGNVENYAELTQRLQHLRQQRNRLQDKDLPVGSSFRFDSFQQTLDSHTVIVEWYITSETFFAFIITKDAPLAIWQSTSDDSKALLQWIMTYLETYGTDRETWSKQLADALQNLAQILHLDELLAYIPSSCNRLVLIPHRYLHLFPLHALPIQKASSETEPRYLLDIFSNGVSYAPSCQLLQQLQMRQRSGFDNLFAIQTPTPDLYEEYEHDLGVVGAIGKQFAHAHILRKAKATKSALLPANEARQISTQNEQLSTTHCLFFFCHGKFYPNSPLDSELQLADDRLTIAEIIAHFHLDNCRLVTLSACETGMSDPTSSDEYISFPYGFLLAGSTNVVSSLWTVDATATALLMAKFYEELQQQDNIALALRAAQFWLRDTTVEGFQAWIACSQLSSGWQTTLKEVFDKWEQEMSSTTQLFNSPDYWSAFCAVGKGE